MAASRALVRVDAGELLKFAKTTDAWARDQLPFATAAALTDTAKAATAHVRDGLAEHFTVRNLGFRNAVQYQAADKRAHPIEARVGTAEWASFLTLQALGGTKKAIGGHRVAVPTSAIKRTASGRIPKRLKPRVLRQSKRLAVGVLEKRGLIALQAGRTLRVLFTLVASARIPKRWPLGEEVSDTVAARLGEFFAKRLAQATATAR